MSMKDIWFYPVEITQQVQKTPWCLDFAVVERHHLCPKGFNHCLGFGQVWTQSDHGQLVLLLLEDLGEGGY